MIRQKRCVALQHLVGVTYLFARLRGDAVSGRMRAATTYPVEEKDQHPYATSQTPPVAPVDGSDDDRDARVVRAASHGHPAGDGKRMGCALGQGARPHAARYGVAAWGDGVDADPIAAHPTGPDCGTTGEARGTPARDRHTHGGQTIALERNAVGTDRWDAVWAAIARNSAGR